MHGPAAAAFSKRKPDRLTEVQYQVQRFHSFLWASGGLFSDFYIHQVDECCWMKDAWPVQAHALGGRHYRGESIDQNFDTYSVEYTFHDGTKFFLQGRTMSGCHDDFSSTAHGTRGIGIISKSGHAPGRCAIFRGHNVSSETLEWRARQPEADPYALEWEDLLEAIRTDKPYNEVKRGVTASLVTSMGRMAAHTGQLVTYEDMLNSDHEFAPNVDKLTVNSQPPVKPDANGRYPIPMPGINTKREY
jgi:predicted dehydrogenase